MAVRWKGISFESILGIKVEMSEYSELNKNNSLGISYILVGLLLQEPQLRNNQEKEPTEDVGLFYVFKHFNTKILCCFDWNVFFNIGADINF